MFKTFFGWLNPDILNLRADNARLREQMRRIAFLANVNPWTHPDPYVTLQTIHAITQEPDDRPFQPRPEP